ncbi:hypothetical protein [Paraflavitalea speifideaquila]|uniref:hypothetical protein n=1 Tax=Paraflavitalea speifideaquila TaxID=3076558 RepID=UPI0028E7127A|nr:hypothetical protein [Paraflavitalea speifideiaquila]
MKRSNPYIACLLLLTAFSMTGCYKLQTDYKYQPKEADPKVNMTVKDYILSRGTSAPNNDTIFKWMQMAIEYSGIDITEYENPAEPLFYCIRMPLEGSPAVRYPVASFSISR